MFYKIQNNNKLKRAFFLACVPVAFDEIDLDKLFVDNSSTLEIKQDLNQNSIISTFSFIIL